MREKGRDGERKEEKKDIQHSFKQGGGPLHSVV